MSSNFAALRVPHTNAKSVREAAAAFGRWVVANGGDIRTPTNEYEVLRFNSVNGIALVWTNNRNELIVSGTALPFWEAHQNKVHLPVSRKVKRRVLRTKEIITALAARDGWNCFFCDEVLTVETATIEHLCSVAIGGPNHMHNFCLLCLPCNSKAGSLPVVQKIKMRDRRIIERFLARQAENPIKTLTRWQRFTRWLARKFKTNEYDQERHARALRPRGPVNRPPRS